MVKSNKTKYNAILTIMQTNPFQPILVFVLSWTLMLLAYTVQIGNFYDPSIGATEIIINIFFISFASFSLSYLLGSLIHHYSNQTLPSLSFRDKQPTKTLPFTICLIMLCILILILNLYLFGWFPLIAKTLANKPKYDYMHYGKLKSFLYPACSIIFLLSLFTLKGAIRIFCIIFSVLTFILYFARGPLITTLLQALIMYFFFLPRTQRKKFFLYAIGFFLTVLVLMAVLGSIRTGNTQFLIDMQIKAKYQQWPSSMLWFITYLSAPLTNLVAYIKGGFYEYYNGTLLLKNLLPSFVSNHLFSDLPMTYKTYWPNIHNTASTYLGDFYLNFSWLGIILCNALLGLTGSLLYLRAKQRTTLIPTLLFSTYCATLIMLFFDNMFFTIATVTQYAIILILSIFIKKIANQ